MFIYIYIYTYIYIVYISVPKLSRKPAGHVHALASTDPRSDAEKGAEHAEHAALPATGLYVPSAHKVHTPALPVDPAAHTATIYIYIYVYIYIYIYI